MLALSLFQGLAGIAQLVEQRIRNAWVVGSNPIPGSILFWGIGARYFWRMGARSLVQRA